MTAPQYEAASDEELMARTRGGDADGFGELWRRHSDAAHRAAWQFRSVAEPDDLVAEAYTRILDAIRRGRGPRGAFRPYLFVTIRNLVNRMSHAPHAEQVEDFDEFVAPATLEDPTVQALDRSLTASAFRSLPERWQAVLWYTEVEELSPREAAPLLGLTANGTSALAYRARAGLREAWLQAHVADETASPECRWFLARVGSYTAGSLTAREARRAEKHLSGCERCTIIAGEVDDVGSRLALVLIPLLLGPAAGSAYLASLHGTSTASALGASRAGPAVGASSGVPAAGAPGASAAATGLTVGSKAAVAGGALLAKVVPAAVAVLAVSAIVTGTVVAAQQPWPAATGGASASPRDAVAGAPVASLPPAPPAPEPSEPEPEPEAPPPDTVTQPPARHPLPAPSRPGITDPDDATPGDPGTEDTPPDEAGEEDTDEDPDERGEDAGNEDARDPDAGGAEPADTDPAETEPADTEALAPVVTSPVLDDQRERPSLTGTAEPGATITVTDQDGTVLAEVSADEAGAWATEQLAGLSPSATQLLVGQTDRAGNSSPLTVLGPFAFHPVLVAPSGEASCQSGSPAPFELAGWAGEPVLYSIDIDGDVDEGFLVGQPDADGSLTFHLVCETPAVTEVVLRFYYAGTDPASGPSIIVRLLP